MASVLPNEGRVLPTLFSLRCFIRRTEKWVFGDTTVVRPFRELSKSVTLPKCHANARGAGGNYRMRHDGAAARLRDRRRGGPSAQRVTHVT